MAQSITDDELIFYWNERKRFEIEKRDLPISLPEYCNKYKLDIDKARNTFYRLYPWGIEKEHRKKEEIRIALLWNSRDSIISKSEFMKIHNIKKSRLEIVSTWIRWMNIIYELTNDESAMQFLKLEPEQESLPEKVVPVKQEEPDSTVIPKSNEISVMVNQDIKISFYNKIQPERLAKIINFMMEI
jgi:hypothetical protein